MVRIKKLFSLSLLFSLLAASFLSAMELSPESIRGNRLEPIGLSYDEEGFTVTENDLSTRVQRYDTDKMFRGKTKKQIAAFAAMGKFKISKFDNGEYSVKADGGLNGGGPVTASILYGLTKFLCWTGVATGAGVVATGVGAATLATGGATGLLGAGAATAVGIGVPTGAAIVGSVAAAAVPTATAVAVAQGAVVAGAGIGAVGTAGLIAGTATAIEGVSLGAFAFGMALPLP